MRSGIGLDTVYEMGYHNPFSTLLGLAQQTRTSGFAKCLMVGGMGLRH